MAVANAARLGVGLGGVCADVVESLNALLKRAYNDHTARGGGMAGATSTEREAEVVLQVWEWWHPLRERPLPSVFNTLGSSGLVQAVETGQVGVFCTELAHPPSPAQPNLRPWGPAHLQRAGGWVPRYQQGRGGGGPTTEDHQNTYCGPCGGTYSLCSLPRCNGSCPGSRKPWIR